MLEIHDFSANNYHEINLERWEGYSKKLPHEPQKGEADDLTLSLADSLKLEFRPEVVTSSLHDNDCKAIEPFKRWVRRIWVSLYGLRVTP